MPPRRTWSRGTQTPKPKRNYSKSSVRSGKWKATIKRQLRINGVYNFTRYASSVFGTGLTFSNPGTVVSTSTSATFALNQVQGYADFTSLFDLYKIVKVDMKINLLSPNPDNTQGSAFIASTYYPKLWWCWDYDDSSNLSLDQIKEKQGVKYAILKPNAVIKISCIPKFQAMTYKTPTATGYGPRTGYLDTVDSGIPHYALKFVLDMNGVLTGVTTNVIAQCKYHLSFKNPE